MQTNNNELYASVLELDRTAIKALGIRDPYSIHRVVYSLFEDRRMSEGKGYDHPSGILWADQGGDFFTRKILIFSDRRPFACVPGGHGSVKTKPVPERLFDWRIYRFKVIVNPTRRMSATGRIVPVKGREAVADWFAQRAKSSWGFSVPIPHLQVDAIKVLNFKGKNGNSITISAAAIQGILEVEDRERFEKSVRKGIGRAKAFGCGLLQIFPMAR